MKLKDKSVNIWDLQPQMQPVLKEADKLWQDVLQVELTITSARDGIHSAGSLHYYGYAVDLRTWDTYGNQLSDEFRKDLADQLAGKLSHYSVYYDIVVHSTHIHVEYDCFKAGAVFL